MRYYFGVHQYNSQSVEVGSRSTFAEAREACRVYGEEDGNPAAIYRTDGKLEYSSTKFGSGAIWGGIFSFGMSYSGTESNKQGK